MIYRNPTPDFKNEDDLESFMEIVLPQLLATLGVDLLIIGRQVVPGPRCRIDLLAIDSHGAVTVIELKLGTALPETIAQVLDYLRSIETRSRDEFIRLACDEHGVDLPTDFQQHYGRPLPEGVNETQRAIVVAASFHPRTESGFQYLQNKGHRITTLLYDVHPDGVSLTPARLDDGTSEISSIRWPLQQRRRLTRAVTRTASVGYKPRIDVQWFWQLHASCFVAHTVTLSSIYELYQKWMNAQASQAQLGAFSLGPFGRQLRNLLESSGDWTRVYLLPGTSIDPYEELTDSPSTRAHRTDGHRIVAYQRTTVAARADR